MCLALRRLGRVLINCAPAPLPIFQITGLCVVARPATAHKHKPGVRHLKQNEAEFAVPERDWLVVGFKRGSSVRMDSVAFLYNRRGPYRLSD